MGIDDVASSGFSAGAEDYERGRPSYAADAVDFLVEHLGIGPGTRVADVAAGTGKLTRLLAAHGADIVAIEPVQEMRAQLTAASPDIVALPGTAEDLPFPDASLDVVTVAQAFHWFDPIAAVAEFGRVLRPGGGLGIIFNERDTREPWVAELSRLIRWDEREQWRVPYTMEVDWAPVVANAGGPFGPADRYDTTYLQPMTPDLLVARVLSTSYLAVLSSDDKDRLAVQVKALVAPFGEAFDLPYVSVAYAFARA